LRAVIRRHSIGLSIVGHESVSMPTRRR